ncbi:MAG TPA: peptidylprolyl isomerase [Pyrinomonadaceae bacterium]|nr:peptidylprolyl isomerase [Pyrinomonadaceae bacterium]
MNKIFVLLLLVLALCIPVSRAQIMADVAVQIVIAEDARAYDKSLEDLMSSPDDKIRERAALAAGRIGSEAAIPALTSLLQKEKSAQVQAMAAFALGEIESIKAADAIIKILQTPETTATVRARAVEAAGKIAAANSKDESSKKLGDAILDVLLNQNALGAAQDKTTVLLALTAALRAKPADTGIVVARFLTNADARVRADAANTLSRVRAKNADDLLRKMLSTDSDPIARANAARALGSAEDHDAFDLLLTAATTDSDLRVRVSAIRSLGALKDAKAADKLLDRADLLFAAYKKSKFADPVERNELLEIADVFGRLLAGSKNARAIKFLDEYARADDGMSLEISLARFKIAPGKFDSRNEAKPIHSWRQWSTMAQVLGELADVEPLDDEVKKMKADAPDLARTLAQGFAINPERKNLRFLLAGPDFLQAFAKYKTDDLNDILRQALKAEDVFVRAAAAGLLAEPPASSANMKALETAFAASLVSDKRYDDAQLAILDAMFKINKTNAIDTLYTALDATDYLVRKKAFDLLRDPDLQQRYPGIANVLESAIAKKRDQVFPYDPKTHTKLGQLLNTDADYRRALSRKNGTVKAIITTEKGAFTIDLLPDDAPLTVDNFIKLARSNYFNGVEVHRVVPNFVMQDGDPRGDGNGGPGWSIRCEINTVPYDRGAVGMALSGKDTGGSQWFVTHSPQPHLDGGYTVFGKVSDADMKVVDNIVRGDKIVTIKIIENGAATPTRRKKR